MVFGLLLAVLLVYIAYSDFRKREVSLWALLAGIVLAAIRSAVQNNFNEAIQWFALNLLGCIVMLLVAFLLIYLLRRKLFNPVNTLIGAGDLVFFPIVCMTFSPVNFLLFTIGSFAFALLLKLFFFRNTTTIPLLGAIALPMAVVVVVGDLFYAKMGYNDLPALRLLYGA